MGLHKVQFALWIHFFAICGLFSDYVSLLEHKQPILLE
jgi:hypothetical protein